MKNWIVYLVKCSDDTLYCGVTNNIKNRLVVHNAGRGAKYTRSRLPVTLLLVSKVMSKSEALKLEHRVKRQRANAKVAYLREHAVDGFEYSLVPEMLRKTK